MKSWRSRSGYAVVEVGASAVEFLLQIYLLELYVLAGLSPGWAGLAIAVAVLWDAVSDPLVGVLVDRHGGRRGARRKLAFIATGLAVAALAVACLLAPAAGASQPVLFVQLLSWYLLLNTGMTLVAVPHLSLINDLARDEGERSQLFGWRLALGAFGLIVALGIPVALAAGGVGGFQGEGAGLLENRAWTGRLVAALLLVTGAVTLVTLRRQGWGAGGVEGGQAWDWRQGPRQAWRSRLFRVTVLGFVFLASGRALNAALALLFYKLSLDFEEGEVSLMLLALTVTIIVSVPLWVRLARRWGKTRLCLWAIVALSGQTAVTYPFLEPGAVGLVLVIAVLGGFLVASVVLLEALISDVVEYDQRSSAIPLAGVYYGLWKLLSKVARAIGLLLASLFLWLVGFEEGALEQSAFTERSIAWVFGPGVAVFFAAGAICVWRLGRLLPGDFHRKEGTPP